MNKSLKLLFVLLLSILLLSNIFGAPQLQQVTKNDINSNSATQTTGEFLAYLLVWFMGIGVIFILFVGFCLFLFWIVYKIYKKLTEYNRGKKDFFYKIFTYDLLQTHYNHDKNLKKRNWKLFWLFWKRKPVYAETSEGLKVVGLYHGETDRKGDFFLIGLYNKVGMFKYLGNIILIPYSIKNDIVKKYNVNGENSLILKCEGIDRSIKDLYFIPLIKDKDNKNFLDFTDEVRKKYIDIEVYRDIINENLQNYREGIIKSVESNPNIHFKRRMPKD